MDEICLYMPLLSRSSLTLKCMQLLCCANLPIPLPTFPRHTQVPTRVDFHDLSTSQLEPGECKSSIYQTNNGSIIYFLGEDGTYARSL